MKNQKILDCCTNFNDIVNCDFLEDDVLTKRLIEYYQDFVFNIDPESNEQIDLIKRLDMVMRRYIDDYRFAKSLKDTLDIDAVTSSEFSYLDQLMQYLIQFFSKYENEYVHDVVETRWI